MSLARLAPLFVASLLSFACGGGSQGGNTAHDAEAGESSGTSEDGSGWTGGSEEPRGPDCSDGTCFSCGEGICPKGAYCDQDAQGGAACAWLTECSGAPSCDCVTKVLGSGCSCSEDGGPSVSCN